ncbi:MAG: hypothetical protein KJ767_01405 [Nanoarchaeota archaeon]|nr:hypothetical protein [Nanoarchaeota archaeon]
MLTKILFAFILFSAWFVYLLIKKPYKNPYQKRQKLIWKKTFMGVFINSY